MGTVNIGRTRLAACLAVALLMGCASHATPATSLPALTATNATRPGEDSPPTGIADELAHVVEQDLFIQHFRKFSEGPVQGAHPTGTPGSGSIVCPDGYMLADAQVVAGAAQAQVKMSNRREFKAYITGIVGSKERLRRGETYIPLIQADLALNAGASGAPLFNPKGEVVSIDVLALQPHDRLSFATPIDAAVKVAEQLQLDGKAERDHLGLTFQNLTYPIALPPDFNRSLGALVSSVDSEGSAAKALCVGNIVPRINDKAVRGSRWPPIIVADLRPGADVSIEHWRPAHSTDVAQRISRRPLPVMGAPTYYPSGQSAHLDSVLS